MRPIAFAALVFLAALGALFLWLELASGDRLTVELPPVPAAPAAKASPEGESDQALVDKGPYGPLPRVAADGRMPWRVYGARFEGADGRPRIAVVIANLGLARAVTKKAIDDLPAVVTLAFSPYAADLPRWARRARGEGHEILVMAPMEPVGYPSNDPGDQGLLTALPAEDNLARLHWIMSRFTGYVGVAAYMGSRFQSSAKAMRPVLEEIKGRGLLFLDNGAATTSAAAVVARELGVPWAAVTGRIDRDLAPGTIDAALADLAAAARRDGSAVALGFAYPLTVDRVGAWLRTLRSQGIAAVPLTDLVAARMGARMGE